MCGLVGIAGALSAKDEHVMRRLLLQDYFRGTDSTGLAALRDNGKEVKIAKIASHPLDLFDSLRFKDALKGFESQVFLGHNRAATRGVVNNINAHPYHFGDIVGAHNGTLDYRCVQDLEDVLDEKFAVDSMAIFASIDKFGLEDTIKSLRGAWALTYINLADNTLNFIKNDQRPLWYSFNKEMDRIMWASEYPMMQAAYQLSPVHHEIWRDKDQNAYFPFETDVHYKFDLADLKKTGKATPTKPVVKVIKGKEPAPVQSSAVGHDPFNRHTGPRTPSTTTSTTNSGGSTASTNNVVHMFASNASPFGDVIDKERFEELAKYGCCWCGSDIAFGDAGVTIFERDDIMLCSSCSTGEPETIRIHLPALDKYLD